MTTSPSMSPVVISKRIALPKSGREAILVSLNRPDQYNCFDASVCKLLSSIFAGIASETSSSSTSSSTSESNVAAVIFTGEGTKAFCAGADLTNPPNPLEQSSDLMHNLRNNPVYQMKCIPVPIIGAVRGHCITGGFELALACDILVGDCTTQFRDTHVKFGLAPTWGLSQKLQRRIGPGRAKLVSYTARPIGAQVALEWGLLDEVIPGDGLTKTVVDRALEIADEIGRNDLVMVKRYKRALEEGGSMDLSKGLQRERELGLAHYLEIMNDGKTFESAKEFIRDDERPRSKL